MREIVQIKIEEGLTSGTNGGQERDLNSSLFKDNSLGKGKHEPQRRPSKHLNPTCDSPAQVSYSGGSKVSLRGVFTDLVSLTHRPLGRQIHRYGIAFLVASVAMASAEVTGLHFFLCHTKFKA